MTFKKIILSGALAMALAAPAPSFAQNAAVIGPPPSNNNAGVFLLVLAVAAIIFGGGIAGGDTVLSTQNGDAAPDLGGLDGGGTLWKF